MKKLILFTTLILTGILFAQSILQIVYYDIRKQKNISRKVYEKCGIEDSHSPATTRSPSWLRIRALATSTLCFSKVIQEVYSFYCLDWFFEQCYIT